VLLAAIQFAVVMPMMMRQAVDPQPFSVIGLMAAFLVVGLVWMAMSESAWHRLLTGREAGAFPYRLSADELRMAGCWLLVVLASLILHSPLIAFVVWTAMHADGFPWAALWMLPLSWAISLAVFSRAAPLVPWAIVHRRFRPLSVLRASGAVWGKVALPHILLVLGLIEERLAGRVVRWRRPVWFMTVVVLIAVPVRHGSHALPERLSALVQRLPLHGAGGHVELLQHGGCGGVEVLAGDVAVAVLVEGGETAGDLGFVAGNAFGLGHGGAGDGELPTLSDLRRLPMIIGTYARDHEGKCQ
jgi:hypothetical protein